MHPMKQQLTREYPFHIELHAHTSPASMCAELSPEDTVRLYHSLGYDGIVISNHFYASNLARFGITKDEQLRGYLTDSERAMAEGERLGIRVYLGAELRFPPYQNDYLLFGATPELLSRIYDVREDTFEQFRARIPLPACAVVMAHPFRDGMHMISDPSLLDGVEVFNLHPGHNSRVGLCAKFAKEKDIPIITAGSDFHSAAREHQGTTALRTRTLARDSIELAQILRTGDYLLEVSGSLIVP